MIDPSFAKFVEQRRRPRISVDGFAVVTSHERRVTARLHNISAGGALVGPMFDAEVGDRCELEIPGYGPVDGVVVRVTQENDVAICFSPDPQFRAFCDDEKALIDGIQAGRLALSRERTRASL